MMFAVFMFFVALWAVCIAAPVPGPEGTVATASPFNATTVTSTPALGSVAAWCFGIFVIVIVIALLALAINVILSKLRSAWACHLDELAANAAELGLRVKVAEEKAAEEAALRLEAEQRFESCEREVNELRSRLETAEFECQEDQAESASFESVLSECTSQSETCITIPPPAAADLEKHVGGSSLAALFRQTFECQEDQAESASFKSVSSECTSQSETCITIPPPATADLEKHVGGGSLAALFQERFQEQNTTSPPPPTTADIAELRAQIDDLEEKNNTLEEKCNNLRDELMIEIEDYDKLVYLQETTQQCAEEMSQPYTYIEEVNQGAYGRIAKIQDANGQLRALKTIATKVERLVHPTSCGAEAAVLLDIKEKKLEHLTHPAVYEVLETDRFTQVVTDFYPCDTVDLTVAHKEAHGTPLPTETVIDLAAQLLHGVAYNHAQGVAHRDIKPENLMVSDNGQLKIIDYGVAKRITNTMDEASSFVGTTCHMAPEIWEGLYMPAAADWFACGTTLFGLFTGLQAFPDDDEAYLDAVQNPVDFSMADVSAEVESLLKNLLDLNPANRLGMRGIEEIKAHPVFRSYDWVPIERGTATLRGWENLRALVVETPPPPPPPPTQATNTRPKNALKAFFHGQAPRPKFLGRLEERLARVPALRRFAKKRTAEVSLQSVVIGDGAEGTRQRAAPSPVPAKKAKGAFLGGPAPCAIPALIVEGQA